ncbi:YmjA family protein [Serratia proteamaculans]
MSNDIPLKYYDFVDEYATEAAQPVTESERTPLARYFELLMTHLTNNEEISEEQQKEMATEAGIHALRIDDIATFLNQWGNE